MKVKRMTKKYNDIRKEMDEDIKEKVNQQMEMNDEKNKNKNEDKITFETKEKRIESLMSENLKTIGFIMKTNKATDELIEALIDCGKLKRGDNTEEKKRKAATSLVENFMTKEVKNIVTQEAIMTK